MKYFLDSAKINEIREAYDTFGIDGVTTNPNHIMLAGKPFKEVLKDMVDFVQAGHGADPHADNRSKHLVNFNFELRLNPCSVANGKQFNSPRS